MASRATNYAFKVAKDATKREIKSAVESLFNVKVANVTTLNVKGKRRRTVRGQMTRLAGWKKAYIRAGRGREPGLHGGGELTRLASREAFKRISMHCSNCNLRVNIKGAQGA